MLKKIAIISILVIFGSVFVACEQEGPAEKAGEKIDETVEEAAEKAEEAGEAIEEKAEEASEEVKKVTE
jgi:hypothetical protein